MPSDRDEESGKFTQQYESEAFLKAVSSINNATTSRIADEVGCSYDLAYRRLKSLEEENEVEREEVGGSFIWLAD